MQRRIGIFAGSFDPVHDGHISFALAAAKAAKLNKVYFLPEVVHRTKSGVSHLAHRLAMLKLATETFQQLTVLELPDKQFSVAKTLPRLNQKFPDDRLFLIVGSDVLQHMPGWPLIERLLDRMGLVIGLRSDNTTQSVKKPIKQLPIKPPETVIMQSPAAKLSSARIRQSLLSGQSPPGLDPKVLNYIKTNWLYALPSNSNSAS